MAKTFENAAVVAKDNDGNKAIVRGGSQEDWEKVGKGLQQIPNLNKAVTGLIELLNSGIGSSVEIAAATDAKKGIVQLTDDPEANQDAATGATAITPKAIQSAMAALKEEAAGAEVELNDATASQKGIVQLTDDPKANKDAATGVTAITPKAIQAAMTELQGELADVSVEVEVASDAQKGITYLTDDYKAEKDAATGVTAITPKAIQGAIEELKGKIEAGEIEIVRKPPSPFDDGFGVGVAPADVYESLNLKPLPGTEDKSSFQYGLYEATAPADDENDTTYQTYHAYLKYIPKYYHCFLSNDDATLMDESQLRNLIQYTGLTVAQMKQAQERAGTAAIALAPANVFVNEEEANAHGFILNRGYYDDGKEKPGFFIANTLTSYFQAAAASSNTGKIEIHYYCGSPEFRFTPSGIAGATQGIARLAAASPSKYFSIGGSFQFAINLGRKFTGCNCMGVGMWQVLRMICFAAGLYAKDNTECAWFRGDASTGFWCAAPCGINNGSATGQGTGDRDVTSVTTSPVVAAGSGTVWVADEEQYRYTTHNGRINGITNCNGWVYQPVLGFGAHGLVYNISRKLADETGGAEFTDAIQGTRIELTNGGYWGSDGSETSTEYDATQPLSRDKEHTASWYSSFLYPQPTTSTNPVNAHNLFGFDSFYDGAKANTTMAVGYYYNGGSRNTGIFNNQGLGTWATARTDAGCRIGGYPEI